jgi:hypothetical protein
MQRDRLLSRSTTPRAQAFQDGTINPMTLSEAQTVAPAIFATEPASYINLKRYNFVPTTDIIEKMTGQGWVLTNAKQSSTNSDLRMKYGVHTVEFQNPELFIKDSIGGVEGRPTVIFMNSHDGSRPIQSELGIFRLVCSNGLVIKSQDFGGFRERHTRLTNDAVKSLLEEKIQLMDSAVQKINKWNGVEMKSIDMRKFATDALVLRIGEDRQPEDHEILSILEPKRSADSANTLWHVYNRVQENLIKGGFDLGNRVARAITNPLADMKLNQDLWQLAEDYAS